MGKAAVVNINRYPVGKQFDFGYFEVPGCSGLQPYSSLVIEDRRSMKDYGDGRYEPIKVPGEEIARDLAETWKDHGVFVSVNKVPTDTELEAARNRRLAWYREIYTEAVDSWTRYKQYRLINDRQRDAARELLKVGEIAELPEWVQASGPETGRMGCPACGGEIRYGAAVCRHCGAILDEPRAQSYGLAGKGRSVGPQEGGFESNRGEIGVRLGRDRG